MKASASDIRSGNWVDTLLPPAARPYARLARWDRPIGIWLLLLPGWWGMALASPGLPSLWFLALFAIGAILMRGAGCTLNDIVDRDFDRRVARTADRPLASRQISLGQAVAFMVTQCLLALLVLVQFNTVTILVGASSLLLVAAYPFAKRVTDWPQAVLGLTFNWGALIGWTAVTGSLDAAPIALYGAGILWTLGYDTIYAHQDKEDDLLIGVRSTALRLGDQTRPWLWGFYGGAIVLLTVAGALAGLGWPWLVGLALAAAMSAWQVRTVDLDNARDCLAKFKANRDVGLVIFGAIMLGRLGG